MTNVVLVDVPADAPADLSRTCWRTLECLKAGGNWIFVSNKKRLFSKLQDRSSVVKVFDVLSSRYQKRQGGYSRVLKAGFRYGDDSPMAIIELVDRNIEAKKVDKPKKVETKEKDAAQVAATK